MKIIITEEQYNLFKKNKLTLNECTIAAVRLEDGIVLAKNRDRGYKARMEVVHEIIDDVEVLYWHDLDTDWSEGMNEFGIGIVNSSLMVRQDEKEGDKVLKSKKPKKSYDGEKLRHALSQKTIQKVIKSIISYEGDDKKEVGVKGETFVADDKNIYVIEMTSKDVPVIKKVNKNNKVTVRTNHGLVHKQAGYTKGIKKISSHTRMMLAKKHLQDVKTDKEVIDKMKEQYNKNKFLNPYRLKNQYNMSTTGQIMMNLEKKEVVIRMDNEMGEFEGIRKKLPKDYTPKISIKIESEKTHNEDGDKLPT
jgi:hypothetical protein